jgi:hypothetical protein
MPSKKAKKRKKKKKLEKKQIPTQPGIEPTRSDVVYLA